MAVALLLVSMLAMLIGGNLIALKSRRRLGKRGLSDQRLAANAFKEMKNFNGLEWLAVLVLYGVFLTLGFFAVQAMNGT